MENIEIISAGNSKYIGEFLNEFPENSMINKVAVGSGATSVVLRDKAKVVLCVPFVPLIKNKLAWCNDNGIDAIGIYYDKESGFNTIDYLPNFKGDKIIVTYDSLHRVIEHINPADWKIVVDESHKLIDSGAFRGKAIRAVLNNYSKFKSHCFITATPVPDKYQYPELREIRKYQIKWDNLSPVNIKYMPVEKNLFQTTSVIALSHLTGKSVGNAHLFINSVEGIVKTINFLKKSGENIKDNVRIVCADNDKNDKLIKLKLGAAYHNEPNTTEAKSINFYTSTCFEGSDIYDTEGVSYIITDGSKDYSKIDILTTLPQIAGRIRDSKYKNDVTLVFTSSPYFSNTTEEEFELFVKGQLEYWRKAVNDFRIVCPATKELMLKNAEQNNYLFVEDEELELNEQALYNEMFSYNTIHNTYYINRDDKQTTFKPQRTTYNDIEYNYTPKNSPQITGLNKLNLDKVPDFKDLCIEYIGLQGTNWDTESGKIAEAYPIIKEAFNKLGAEKMKALKYRQKDIQKELIIQDKVRGYKSKLVELLGYKVGQWLTSQQIKSDLERIYSSLGIDKQHKATDITEFYSVKKVFKKLQGVSTEGYTIIHANIK